MTPSLPTHTTAAFSGLVSAAVAPAILLLSGPLHPAADCLARPPAPASATEVLSGHVQPDADARGSTLALAEGLRRCGARVVPTFPEPFTLPASLGWLPGADQLVPPDTVPADVDVFVSLDAASPRRLGDLARLLDTAGRSVVVDHHEIGRAHV